MKWHATILTLALITNAHASDVARLSPQNFAAFAPKGKEADAIYGDYVLRNRHLIAVIANPLASRNANMTVRGVGGCLIDLTRRDRQSDQLSAYWPDARRTPFRNAKALANGKPIDGSGSGSTVSVVVNSVRMDNAPDVKATWSLNDEREFLRVVVEYHNPHNKAITIPLTDSLRADRTFRWSQDKNANVFWVEEYWWGQSYGFTSPTHTVTPRASAPRSQTPSVFFLESNGKRGTRLKPGETLTATRDIIPHRSVFGVREIALKQKDTALHDVEITARDADGGAEGAELIARRNGQPYARVRTDASGVFKCRVPAGKYEWSVRSSERGEASAIMDIDRKTSHTFTLPKPGFVSATITDEKGGPIPCKVQFVGIDGTRDPYFFDDTGEHGVRNCYYSHNGRFRQPLLPGQYKVIISRGPEYDAVFQNIKVERGADTPLGAKLIQTVDTRGWVSAEFHSHSSPSGDNVSSQFGRVLNLLAEHLEYAPCTEHNRLSTYTPHLKQLGVEHLMATCSGMELTGNPGDVNHQNAFPLIRKPHTQDGGAPQTHGNPIEQIKRLAMWDDKSDKLVQQNHPNILRHAFDRNLDGKYDGGYQKMIGYMDVIEVHPPSAILRGPSIDARKKINTGRNRMHSWLLMLNHGHRIPGVVNTDAHYNFHGSGFLRNWVRSTTDDPAKIKTPDIVSACRKGHIVMSNGPFMEVTATTDGDPTAGPGDDLRTRSGKIKLHIRVQCPNWLDIDRVQVLLNGIQVPELNHTRSSNPQSFGDKVVKFDQTIPIHLKQDAHIIVVATRDKGSLKPIFPRDMPPTAVSNPIFVDTDANGFTPNQDTLGQPAPTEKEESPSSK